MRRRIISFFLAMCFILSSIGAVSAKNEEPLALGIDVSRYQGIINWQSVKASGVDFAILRLGYTGFGTLEQYADETFNRNYWEALSLGLGVGAYYYSCATDAESGIREAEFVLEMLDGKRFDYPIYMDVENKHNQSDLSNEELTEAVIAFCETIENAGYYPGIYANLTWFENKLNSPELNKYTKWVAQWGDECTYSGEYDMWQYTDSGSVNGISGKVDMNKCYFDFPTYIHENDLNGWDIPLSMTNVSFPSLNELQVGGAFPLRGIIECDEVMDSVTVGVYDMDNNPTEQIITVDVGGKIFDIQTIDYAIAFGSLPAGGYTYRITVKVGENEYVALNAVFNIGAVMPSKPDVTVTVADNNYDAVIEWSDCEVADSYEIVIFREDETTYGSILGISDVNSYELRLPHGGYKVDVIAIASNFHECFSKTRSELFIMSGAYTVQFSDGLTGEVIDTQVVIEGESAIFPEIPIHDGYDYIGYDGDWQNVTGDELVILLYRKTGAIDGDVNGDGKLNAGDAVAILRWLAGFESNDFEKTAADYNRDGNVNAGDAVAILRTLAGMN